MNFIIPKNYKFKPKILGLIDYQSAILNCVWMLILFFLVNILFSNITLKIYTFIGLSVPFLLFSIVGINNENLISVFIYLFKFYNKPKIYLYKK